MLVKRGVALYKGFEFCTKFWDLNWRGLHSIRDELYTRSCGRSSASQSSGKTPVVPSVTIPKQESPVRQYIGCEVDRWQSKRTQDWKETYISVAEHTAMTFASGYCFGTVGNNPLTEESVKLKVLRERGTASDENLISAKNYHPRPRSYTIQTSFSPSRFALDIIQAFRTTCAKLSFVVSLVMVSTALAAWSSLKARDNCCCSASSHDGQLSNTHRQDCLQLITACLISILMF